MEMGIAHLCGISRGFVHLSFTWRVFQHGNAFNSYTSSKLRWSIENALSSRRRHENTPFENENSWPKKCTAFEASIPTWQLMPGSKKSEVVVTSSRTSICFWLIFFWPLKWPGLVRTKMASYFSGAATGTIQLWSGFLRYTDCSSTVWIANAYEIWLRGTSWPRNIPCSNDMQIHDHWSQIPGLVPAISFQVHVYTHTYVLLYRYIYM